MEIEAPKPKHPSSYYEMFNGDKWITLQHANKKNSPILFTHTRLKFCVIQYNS